MVNTKSFSYLTFLIFFALSPLGAESFSLSQKIYESKNLPFQSHMGKEKYSNYVVVDIPFVPISELYRELESFLQVDLKNRGEAHITVITPLEYEDILKDKISVQELHQLAKEHSIQKSSFSVICLGKGTLKGVNPKSKPHKSTYYLVVESEDLLRFRRKVESLFVKRGGEEGAFDAEHFFAHITLGFTHRDLHENEGIIKDKHSCYADLNMVL